MKKRLSLLTTILVIVLVWFVTVIPFAYISTHFDFPLWANVVLIQTMILFSNEIVAQIGPKPFKTTISVVLMLPQKDKLFYFSSLLGANILFPLQAYFFKELSTLYVMVLIVSNVFCFFGFIRLFGPRDLKQALFAKQGNASSS